MTPTEQRIVQKYVWFVTRGVYQPILNHPRVILGKATPKEVDDLIELGFKCDQRVGKTDHSAYDDGPQAA